MVLSMVCRSVQSQVELGDGVRAVCAAAANGPGEPFACEWDHSRTVSAAQLGRRTLGAQVRRLCWYERNELIAHCLGCNHGRARSRRFGELSAFRFAEWFKLLLARRRQDDGEPDCGWSNMVLYRIQLIVDLAADAVTA